MNEPADRPKASLAAPAIALVAGVVVVLVGWQGVRRHAEATRAVAATGRVVRSEVHEHAELGYLPYLEYTWEVGGVRAVDNNAEVQPALADRAAAERVVAAHPTGSEITVYYDPDEPFRASLAGPAGGAALALTVAVVAAVIAAAGVAIRLVTRGQRRTDGAA